MIRAPRPRAAQVPGVQTFRTAAEVAERLGMSLRTMRRLIAAGDLVVHRIGRSVRVADTDVERFLARHRCKG